ncbi:l-galactose dehydrogenase [Fagus crenata]
MLEGLKNIKLMADEEEDITFEDEYWGERIGGKIGRYILRDPKAGMMDQSNFLRIRVDIPINKPLRRGGWCCTTEVEKIDAMQYSDWLRGGYRSKSGGNKARTSVRSEMPPSSEAATEETPLPAMPNLAD